MKKPRVLLLTLWTYDVYGLSEYFDVDYYNYTMPEDVFFEKAKKADLIIEQEFNDKKSLYGNLVRQVKVVKALRLIDSLSRTDHPTYSLDYDHVFVSVDSQRHTFSRPAHYLPVSYPFGTDLMERTQPDRNVSLSFVGHISNYPERKIFFDKLDADLNVRNISHVFCQAGLRNYADIIQNSIIGFNKSQLGDCNYRVFETLGMGAILLTDAIDECFKIPELSDRAFFYNTYDDIFVKIESILSMPKGTMEAKVKDNQEWVKNNHLLKHRYLEIAKHSINYTPKNEG